MNTLLRYQATLTATAVALIYLTVAQIASADQGLVAIYSDANQSVHRIVPTPNFMLAADESIHAQISPEFSAVYDGVLKIRRGGEYMITADAQVVVDGNDINGKTVQLTPGDHKLLISYRRKAGAARLQLRWKSDFFVEEPIPARAFNYDNNSIDAPTKSWAQIEHGRVLYENLSCGSCHGAERWNLTANKAPVLSDVGSRVTDEWLYAWLKNPKHYRESTGMPVLLTEEQDIRDATAFLASLQSNTTTESTKNAERVAAGKEIFEQVGCNKCHTKAKHSLKSIGSKYRSSRELAGFIGDPLHVDPSGRMPQLFEPETQSNDIELVSEYLFHSMRGESNFAKFPGGETNRGQQLIQSTGCIACHAVKLDGKDLTSSLQAPLLATDNVQIEADKGCLAAAPPSRSPKFQFTEEARSSLRAFLQSVSKQPVVAKSPVETFHRRVQQFNCTACHALNDQNNGQGQEVTDTGKIRKIEQPPTLTAAGDKLQVEWIRKVLLEQKRTRPWMNMKMPHFGAGVEQLPALFPAASGSPAKDDAAPPKFELAELGHQIIGVQRGQVACINCHNYRDLNQQKEGVVPAPDMAEIAQTVRREWFYRWLQNPSRLQPGTSMPQFFLELKAEERDAKIDQLWSALVNQAKLPLPKGLLDQRAEGSQVVVGDDPVVFRVATKITPKIQIDRAINVGLPGNLNFTFDAATARLRGVWKGKFINAGPAWNGRGGNPVTVIPESIFVTPDHFPLRIGDATAEPAVRFRGYDLVQKYPEFRYTVDGVNVRERIEVTETELIRKYTIENASKTVFFSENENAKGAYSSNVGKFDNGVL
ncbi:MAG: cytochrome c2, partial [Pirellulaceae bacterium]